MSDQRERVACQSCGALVEVDDMQRVKRHEDAETRLPVCLGSYRVVKRPSSSTDDGPQSVRGLL